jgi:hypothetical protein
VSVRRLPVRPNLDQLKHQAKDLLRAFRDGDPAAAADFQERYPSPIEPARARLADAQLVLARSYQASSWPRLVQAVQLVNAIWDDDLDVVMRLVRSNPTLIRDSALIRSDSNWGPPMTYAANLGRDRIIRALRDLGADDLESALARATLQGKVSTAALIHRMLGSPKPPPFALEGAASTLSVSGTAFLFEIGARVVDETGRRLAPVDTVLQTDARHPAAKHAILEMYAAHGLDLPDTPTMALHRGRLDLLEDHWRRDPGILSRRFSHRDIYPAEMGCGDPIDAVMGTPLDGTTLLHMAVEFDELEILDWLLEKGADVNARASVGAGGFGGWTALFSTVVSQPNFWMNYQARGPFVAPAAEILLARGADPNVRASIWKRLSHGHDVTMARHEYRDVTALSWGRRFHASIFVSEPAMRLIEAAGGTD